MRILSIFTLAAWMCAAGMALAADMTILRTDTSAWPLARVVFASPETEGPADAYNLTLPSGTTVAASSVTELLDQPQPASMVVALDTSRSLSPEHLQAAQNSLSRYVDRLDSNEQLSLLAFNDDVQLVVGFTSDREAFKSTLSRLKLGGQKTELYRAMLYGIENLKNIPGQRTLMVITDGKDEGTVVNLDDVVQAARDNNIRVMVVGLPVLPGKESETYLPIMQYVAEQTGGVYRSAGTAQELGNATYDVMVENQGFATHVYEAAFNLGRTNPQDSGDVEATFSRRDIAGVQPASLVLPVPARALASSQTALMSERSGMTPASETVPNESRNALVTTLAAETAAADVAAHNRNATVVTEPDRADRQVATTTDTTMVKENKLWPWLVALLLFLLLLWLYFNKKRQPAAVNRGASSVPLVIEFPESGMRFPLKPGTMVLGSGNSSDIRLDDPDIADAHVEFCTGDECAMRNLTGSRGVLLNGQAVDQNVRLKAGDVLTFGSTRAVISRADVSE